MTNSTFAAELPTVKEFKKENYGEIVNKYFSEIQLYGNSDIEDITTEMYNDFLKDYTSED